MRFFFYVAVLFVVGCGSGSVDKVKDQEEIVKGDVAAFLRARKIAIKGEGRFWNIHDVGQFKPGEFANSIVIEGISRIGMCGVSSPGCDTSSPVTFCSASWTLKQMNEWLEDRYVVSVHEVDNGCEEKNGVEHNAYVYVWGVTFIPLDSSEPHWSKFELFSSWQQLLDAKKEGDNFLKDMEEVKYFRH